MAEQSAAPPRHHLFIAGTGRAGTSFLVRFLGGMGLETHLQHHPREDWHDEANAGLEDIPVGPAAAQLPYVVKTPWLCEFIADLLADPQMRIDAVVIPVRDLAEAATSRVLAELRATHQSVPWQAELSHTSETWGASPGGIVFSLNPIDQGRLLAVWLYQLVQRLVQADIPLVFLDFPRLANDADYLFGKLQALLPAGATLQQAREVHARLADPAKIRVGGELRAAAASAVQVQTGPVYQDHDTLDHIAIRRELIRLRGALATADAAAEALRARLAEAQAADAAQAALAARIAELEQEVRTSQASQAELHAALAAMRTSTSWRLTAGLRALADTVGRLARPPRD